MGDNMFEGKKILILGMARSGYAAAKTLIERGNVVYLNDAKEEEKQNLEQVKELKEIGVKLVFGSHPDDLLDETFDYLVKNPGVPIKHKYVIKANELNIEVINEVELGFNLLPKNVKVVGITGTNGKTTTTTLTYEILKEAYNEKVILAGNIGYPLTSVLNKIKENDILVTEVSSHQLVNFINFRPNIAVMTNLSPAHIDFFETYKNYKDTKNKIFINQTSKDLAILNYDNEDGREYEDNIVAHKEYFSSKTNLGDCIIKDNFITYKGEKILNINEVLVAGVHNLENIMIAIMIAKQYGVENSVINEVITKFKGVEHRLEYVDNIKGVKFYNDSKATNIECCKIALDSFGNPTIIIMGGTERNQVLEDLLPNMKNVKTIIGIGECRERIKTFGDNNNIETYIFETLKEGFGKVTSIMEPNDIVLLSPATASWDQYPSFEKRGEDFKERVKGLKNDN